MKRVLFELVGHTPIVMHNPRLVDPDDPITRELKRLTGKRKKTDEDLEQIAKLEFHGGLYVRNGDGPAVVVQPTSKVRKCLINMGKSFKQGTFVERALSFIELDVPLVYDGPRDPDALWRDRERFAWRTSVGLNQKRVMRVRPKFMPWALRVEGLFIEDVGLNFEDLERIVELAGVAEGIGDARRIGYGRFEGKVTEVKR